MAQNTTSTGSGSLADSQQQVWQQLLTFLRIVAPAIVVSPMARWLRSHWALRWRMCLMRAYMDRWDPNVPPIEGASQRLHEDTQRFAKGIDAYLAIFLNSICTLSAFSPILLSLGRRISTPVPLLRAFGGSWLLVCAAAAALLGVGMAMIAGKRLVSLEVANQRVEAKLRREAVMLEASPETICGAAEPDTPPFEASFDAGTRLPSPAPHFQKIWKAVHANYSALFSAFLRLNLWLDGFDQLMTLTPYVLTAPRLFAEEPTERISLGTLVQAANSFDKVFASLSVISENWGGINEWRSTLVRLQQFEVQQREAQEAGGVSLQVLRSKGSSLPGSDDGEMSTVGLLG